MKKIVCFALLAFALGCGESTPDKGEEENQLTDGKSDSFFRPTEHGDLQFEIENPAELTDDALFHAWNFALTGEATVVLKTNVTRLDTVMYLYSRPAGADEWGRYTKKNDDFDGNIYSQITHNGDSAEYRVVVKGHKKALRGSFTVEASCDGEGCVEPEAGECRDGNYQAVPAATSFTSGCTDQIASVLGSRIQSENSGSVRIAAHCTVRGIEQVAIEHYASYWLQFGDFEDLFYGDLEEMEFNFEHTTYDNGHLVTVDAGGDEDGLRLLYTLQGDLLASYQINQSPTLDFHCGTDGSSEKESPYESCYLDVLNNFPAADAEPSASENGSDVLDTIAEISYFGVAEAVDDFRQTFDSLSDTESVDYVIDEFGPYVTRIQLTADDIWATYTFIQDSDRPLFVRESTTDNSTIQCE